MWTTHLHLVLKLRISRVIPLWPHTPSWHGQGQFYVNSTISHSTYTSFSPPLIEIPVNDLLQLLLSHTEGRRGNAFIGMTHGSNRVRGTSIRSYFVLFLSPYNWTSRKHLNKRPASFHSLSNSSVTNHSIIHEYIWYELLAASLNKL